MAYINIDEVFILDNTGLQVDMATDIPFADAGFSDDQKAQARKNIAAGGTNPNLLDNSFFTVNQRSFSSATATTATVYCVDRWTLFAGGAGAGTLTKNSNGTLTINNSSGTTNMYMRQPLPDLGITGKTVTISVMLGDGTIYYKSGVVPTPNASYQGVAVVTISSTCEVGFTVAPTTLGYPYLAQVSATAGANVTIRAIKLELGTVSTLANDVPPDYGTELLKCQRYFIRIAPTAYTTLWSGVCINASTFAFNITTPVPMRYANPTISFTGTLDFVEQTTSGASLRSVTGLSAYAPVSNSNNIRVLATTASTLGSNNLACIYTYAYTPVIDVSCDL